MQSTRKITKAMELIAASRIARAQARIEAARPYAEELTRALRAVSSNAALEHPMLTGVAEPRRAGVLVITSDRGLAGGYNANALRRTNELVSELEGKGLEVDRYVIGRKGEAFYRFRHLRVAGVWTGFSEQPNFVDAHGATEAIVKALTATSQGTVTTEGDADKPGIDELHVVYTRFVNSVTQTPVVDQVAPASSATGNLLEELGDKKAVQEAEEAESQPQPDYEFEPDAEQLVDALLPRYITARIFAALLESAASESAARRQAMKSASDNANELIRTYTRLANQARQAEITQEISEIVGGADALANAGDDE